MATSPITLPPKSKDKRQTAKLTETMRIHVTTRIKTRKLLILLRQIYCSLNTLSFAMPPVAATQLCWASNLIDLILKFCIGELDRKDAFHHTSTVLALLFALHTHRASSIQDRAVMEKVLATIKFLEILGCAGSHGKIIQLRAEQSLLEIVRGQKNIPAQVQKLVGADTIKLISEYIDEKRKTDSTYYLSKKDLVTLCAKKGIKHIINPLNLLNELWPWLDDSPEAKERQDALMNLSDDSPAQGAFDRGRVSRQWVAWLALPLRAGIFGWLTSTLIVSGLSRNFNKRNKLVIMAALIAFRKIDNQYLQGNSMRWAKLSYNPIFAVGLWMGLSAPARQKALSLFYSFLR